MIVERLGRFSRIRGPGWQILIPFVERAVVMQPEQFLPGRRGYSAAQLVSVP
jgi:regulator of protease activity HflC (stomatin/prohibitin superfamily)